MSRLMTVKEAAELLGVHLNTVYRWIASDEIGYVRLGSRSGIRISQEHVDRFLAERERKPALAQEAEQQ